MARALSVQSREIWQATTGSLSAELRRADQASHGNAPKRLLVSRSAAAVYHYLLPGIYMQAPHHGPALKRCVL